MCVHVATVKNGSLDVFEDVHAMWFTAYADGLVKFLRNPTENLGGCGVTGVSNDALAAIEQRKQETGKYVVSDPGRIELQTVRQPCC